MPTWTHRDALRLSHPVPPTPAHDEAFRFALGYKHSIFDSPQYITSFGLVNDPLLSKDEKIQAATYSGLPWEAFPTELLNEPDLWHALLESDSVPYGALVRQLPRLTRIGVLDSSNTLTLVRQRLTDPDRVKRSRIHPMNLLNSQLTYKSGYSQRGDSTWKPKTSIVDALDDAFYESFKYVEPTGKRILYALDISGSMGQRAAGMNISCIQAETAMALATLNAEPSGNVDVVGFTSSWGSYGGSSGITPLDLSPRRRLDDNIEEVTKYDFGGTDCALAINWARANKREYDAIIVATDNETWAGGTVPADALRRYRREMKIDTRLVVMAMTATDFSIADPNDPGMLDMAGLSSNAPQLVSNFIQGKF